MTLRFFSDRRRPVHMGPYPLERLARADRPKLDGLPPPAPLSFNRRGAPESLVNTMAEYQAMMDAIRDGPVNKARADCPSDETERANHLKAFGYFSDGRHLSSPNCSTLVQALAQSGYRPARP